MKVYAGDLLLAAVCLLHTFLASNALSYNIVDSSQSTCYDQAKPLTCPTSTSAVFYGQDAQYAGTQPSYTISADKLTVYDAVTGLTWQSFAETNFDGQVSYSDKKTYANALQVPASLNSRKYGGFSDWRLPTIKELYSLISFKGTDPSGFTGTDTSSLTPFINTAYFKFAYGDTTQNERIIDAQYMSSTTYVVSSKQMVFGVNFADGRIKGYGYGTPMRRQSRRLLQEPRPTKTGFGGSLSFGQQQQGLQDSAIGSSSGRGVGPVKTGNGGYMDAANYQQMLDSSGNDASGSGAGIGMKATGSGSAIYTATATTGGTTGGLKFYVLCVRGSSSTYGQNSFKDNGDQTITDLNTGLMWSKADSGSGMAWQQALAWVQTKNTQKHLGRPDWRMPNVKELQSIVDYSRSPDTTSSPALSALFSATSVKNELNQTDWPYYWASTTHASTAVSSGITGGSATYIAFGRAMGYMNSKWQDVHGAGAQRSDPKAGNPADYPTGRGPQGDAIHIYNYVRLVRKA